MPINPSIALSAKAPEAPDLLAQYGRVAAIQQAQNQNALAQYQLAAAQREDVVQNTLNRAYQQSFGPTGEIDINKLRANLAAGGAGAKIPAVEEAYAKIGKQKIETQSAETKLIDDKLKQSRAMLDTIDPADPNAPMQYLQWHEANHRDPVLGPFLTARGVTADNTRGKIVQAIQAGPQAFANLVNQSKLGADYLIQNKPHYMTQDVGGITQTLAVPGLGGAATVVPGSVAQKTMAPGEAARIPLEEERVKLERQRVGLEGRRVSVAEEEAARKAAGQEALLPPKELQKREAARPAATAAIEGFEAKSDSFIKDLEDLINDPGLDQITGIAAGRMPGVTDAGRRAQALYDKIVAKGGFQALQALRDASKTGGALGNVSNQEGKQLQASFAAIDRRQNAEDVRKALRQAIDDVQGARARTREAYDETYAYREGKETASKSATPTAPKVGTVEGGYRFKGGNPADPNSWEKQ